MHTPETVRKGKRYLFPNPAPKGPLDPTNDGFIEVIVAEIFEDRRELYVRLESEAGALEETPHISDFCADVNISELMAARPA